MSGHHPFDQLRARMTPERRAQNAAHTQALQGHDEAASTILVHQTDLYISALRRCIEALGGRLEIVAHFLDGCVTITQFSTGQAV